MKKNVGSMDRNIRLGVAVVAVILAFVVGAGTGGGIVLWIIAAIMAVTALTGSCPVYSMLGKSTCPVDQRRS